MNRYGFNINLKLSPDEIRNLGEKFLGTGLYHAIEVTYYENMEHTDTSEYNRAVKELVEKYHPQVSVHISDFNLSEENGTLRRAILEEAGNCIAYTKELSGREIVVHSGNCFSAIHTPVYHADHTPGTKEENKEKAWGLSVELMQKICDMAAAEDMIIYTENINKDMNTRTTEHLVRYLNDVGRENLKMVFDVGHCHLGGYEIVPEILGAKGILKHLHIHDNHGPNNPGHLDQHESLGVGTIDWKAFVEALQQIGYDGTYMMELSFPSEENLTNCRNVLKRLLEKDN